VISTGMVPETFRLVAQYVNELRHLVPLLSDCILVNIYICDHQHKADESPQKFIIIVSLY
jgi:hypothetical protein